MSDEVAVTIRRESRYKFSIDFGADFPELMADEPQPLGEGKGPSPTHLLAAAVANCLSASFVFACNKYKEDPGEITAVAVCNVDRNEKNRLRVTGINVRITLGTVTENLGHLERVMAQFEDFCTVSQSVRAGIPFAVKIVAPDGTVLK